MNTPSMWSSASTSALCSIQTAPMVMNETK